MQRPFGNIRSSLLDKKITSLVQHNQGLALAQLL
tara:strand:+ start:442 stop:543 length:102 start_codon:yes stop_codon:yes gene_type:complete